MQKQKQMNFLMISLSNRFKNITIYVVMIDALMLIFTAGKKRKESNPNLKVKNLDPVSDVPFSVRVRLLRPSSRLYRRSIWASALKP